MSSMAKVQGVVFDWAGTIIDFGSLAPMGAFVQLFAKHGVTISIAQARVPMGLPKLAHIAQLGATPEIATKWRTIKGRAFSPADALALLLEFEPMSAAAAIAHSAFIPGFLESYAWLQARSVGVATTTGYTRRIMTPLIEMAAQEGFHPALVICCDDVDKSRPDPMGMQRCMQALALSVPAAVVKVDDTAPGLQEGINAGCWTVGVAASGNALGWSWEEWQAASSEARTAATAVAAQKLRDAGAHEVIDSVADLPQVIGRIEARMLLGEQPV